MSGKFAHGTVFSATIGTVPTMTPIADLTNIGGLSISVDELDVTTHDSDGWKEFIAGLKDGGNVELEGNLTMHTSQEELYELIEGGDVVAMSIAFPNSLATWTFNGFVSSFETEAPVDGVVAFTASIKVSGKPTLA